MKSHTPYLVLLLALLAPATSRGADIVLREHATQHGPIIRLGDIADISAATSAEMHDLTHTPLLAAPAPGTLQFLDASQVRELLLARGIRLQHTTLQGAKIVQIGSATQTPTTGNRPTPVKKSNQELTLLVQQAIKTHLQTTTQHSQWRVEVVLQQDELHQLAASSDNLKANGGRPKQTGRQRFTLSTDNHDQPITVYAKIAKQQTVVVVKRPIERGRLVRAADIELRLREGKLPSESLVDLQLAIGKEAKRSLRTDQILQQSHVRAPWQVRRGESVNVYVRTGGIVVRTRAVARENGAAGDLISVELPKDKKRLDASVSGPGEVTVYATGGQATDFASLNRNTTR